jgi:hypothetical protein
MQAKAHLPKFGVAAIFEREDPVARRLRLFFGLTGVMAVLAGFALPSNAGLLDTGPADYCDPNTSQAFGPWSDSSNYMLTPGGSFERGTPAWSLTGGARITSGNESFYINGDDDSRSLNMPSGSSATSPTMCFAAGDWHLRFVGKGSGRVRVTVQVDSLFGLISILDGGTVSPNGSWTPSPRVGLLFSNVGGLLATRAIALKLTARDGSVQIDDVYLDPWKDT